MSYYPGFNPEEGDTMKLIKKSSKANESELIKKKDNTRSNRVILPLASCAYPVPKQSSSMQAGRLELAFLLSLSSWRAGSRCLISSSRTLLTTEANPKS